MTRRPPATARSLAYAALLRIDHEGAYANLLVPELLARSSLDERDRALATSLVYGATRMRRACDFCVDRFLVRDPPPELRTLLRLGAYQLVVAGTPPHAAVHATVELAPPRLRGVTNAVLRKVATTPPVWPDDATRLSYPDWIVARLVAELGERDALATLEAMDRPPAVHVRADGYVQDPSSQRIAELVGARPGERIADLCAAPGGKATAMATASAAPGVEATAMAPASAAPEGEATAMAPASAATDGEATAMAPASAAPEGEATARANAAAAGGRVVALDLRPHRARLVAANAARLGLDDLVTVIGDGTAPPLRRASFDRVLLDAPCSGLGALRRRPDARWRITDTDVTALVELQHRLLVGAAELVRPGGLLAYSVCTLTAAESIDHDTGALAGWPVEPPPGPPWEPYGRGARLLPHVGDADGMVVILFRRPS